MSLGQFLAYTREKLKLPPYIGFDILDRDKFDAYKKERNAIKCNVSELVDHIKSGKIIGRERFGLQRVMEAATRKGMYNPSKDVIGAITDADSEEGTRGIFVPTKFTEKQLYTLLKEKQIPVEVIKGLMQISNRYSGAPLRKVTE